MRIFKTAKQSIGNILFCASILITSGCQSPGTDQVVITEGIYLTKENEVPPFFDQYTESVKVLYLAVRSNQEILKG